MRSVIVKLFDAVQAGENIRLFKSYRQDIRHGEQRRDFVYVKDCARTVVWCLERPSVSGVFNLGTGAARSFLDVAQILLARLDKRVDVEFINMPEALRESYQYFTEADMKKMRSAGMSMEFASLEDGIDDYLGSYLLGRERYR